MAAPITSSQAYHNRFDSDNTSTSAHKSTLSDAAATASDVDQRSTLPAFPEFKNFDSDQELFQSNYFEQFAPKITSPIASFEPQSAQIEHASPEAADTMAELPSHDETFPTTSQLERHFSSASSYLAPSTSVQQHVSPPASQSHANAGNPLPIPPTMSTSPPTSVTHHSSPPMPPLQASLNGHSFVEPSPLQQPFVFPPRNNIETNLPRNNIVPNNEAQDEHDAFLSQPEQLPMDGMRLSDADHAQPNVEQHDRDANEKNPFHRDERLNTSHPAQISHQQMPADDDGFYQHQDMARVQATEPFASAPNGNYQQPQLQPRENSLPPVPRSSSFYGGDNNNSFHGSSTFSPPSAMGDDTLSPSSQYQQPEPAYRGISTAAGGTGNGPMPSSSTGLGRPGTPGSTRPASIAPSTASGPLLDHSHLKVGQKASLLSHGKTLELYRQNAKKTNDPNLIYELAVFMIDAAKTIDDDAPSVGASPGPAPKADSQKEELIKEATGLLKKIADRGHPDGQYFLGDCYANGIGTRTGKQDFSQAYTYFVLAAKHGHPDAAYRAGTCYEKGWGCRKDAGKALQFFRKSAAQSHPGSMYRLATAELNGELGLKKNAKEGVKWLKRSAEAATPEFPHALHELALLHERGIDNVLFVDPEYSCELLAQAGELGYAPSAYKLGVNYEYGRMGCPQDGGLSIHMYNIAAQQNHKEACFALTAWYLVGAPGILPQSDTEAYLWAKKAAEQQLAKAEYAVGYFTEMGIGTVKDLAEAKAWYKRAADHGDKRASQRIAALQGRAAGPQQAINRSQQRQEQRQEQRDSMNEFGRRGQPTSAPFPAGNNVQSSMTPSNMTSYPSPIAMRDAQTAQREQQYMANVAANERSQARAMLRHSPSHGELNQPPPPQMQRTLPHPPSMPQQQQQQQQQQSGPPARQAYPSYPLHESATSPTAADTMPAPPGPVGHLPMQPPQHHDQAGANGTEKKKKSSWFNRS